MVKPHEPGCLAEIGALAADLEGDPLLDVVFLWNGGVAEFLVLVIVLDEILGDCGGLPQSDACVGVVDDGDAAVGVDFFKGWLLDLGHVHEFGFIRYAELLHDDGYFPWVGTRGWGVLIGAEQSEKGTSEALPWDQR